MSEKCPSSGIPARFCTCLTCKPATPPVIAAKERPILFSAPMVRAILKGRKTQTRRAVRADVSEAIEFLGGGTRFEKNVGFVTTPATRESISISWEEIYVDETYSRKHPAQWAIRSEEYPEEGSIPIGVGYGNVGERLWVRETYFGNHFLHPHEPPDERELHYRADGIPCFEGEEHEIRWRPSIHMPRWASRIDLEIVGVHLERLQDISEEAARAEGADPLDAVTGEAIQLDRRCYGASYVAGFRKLWESINGAESWAANPWVWVIEFRRLSP